MSIYHCMPILKFLIIITIVIMIIVYFSIFFPSTLFCILYYSVLFCFKFLYLPFPSFILDINVWLCFCTHYVHVYYFPLSHSLTISALLYRFVLPASNFLIYHSFICFGMLSQITFFYCLFSAIYPCSYCTCLFILFQVFSFNISLICNWILMCSCSLFTLAF